MIKFDKLSTILFVTAAALLLVLWSVVNRPTPVPAWPESLNGVSFSPFHSNQSPQNLASFPTHEQILEDLTLIDERVDSIRTYSVEGSLGDIPSLAAEQTSLDVVVGVWLGSDLERNEQELARLAELAPSFNSRVKSIVVGNEVLLRQELSSFELLNYIQRVRRMVGHIPITVAETWDIWLEHPALAQHVDFVTAHVLPYWEGVSASAAPDYVFTRYEQLQQAFPTKPILLGEVGWPSAGRQFQDAVPSAQNQAVFMHKFLQLAKEKRARYFALEAFDQPWKTQEGEVGRYWGIYDAARNPKIAFEEVTVAPVNWWIRALVATMLLAGLVNMVLLRDNRDLGNGGKVFMVVVSYGVAAFVVWHFHNYFTKYWVGSELILAVVLIACVLLMIAALVIEAHEWAETLWRKKVLPSTPQPPLPAPNTNIVNVSMGPSGLNIPKVSIHLPIYNEPPMMVIKTLQALQRLEYPNFEVIVVDNNTDKDETWQPVSQWCLEQGGPFQFHHVKPLEGFKAGALNYALEHTANDAEYIAVIDSDYVVKSDWLKDCVPLFNEPDVAIVQAPQDYRDADESLFKSMLYCEYAGFFGIGMINRNARNAIIQHGTMTIVRRAALEQVDGWSQWCITEDAELGLKILEHGHRAVYVPTSYGRGLMPDTFHDYRTQRFRWAYGSMRILRHHAYHFCGLAKSNLTAGQRFHFLSGWLPWIADALSLVFNVFAIVFSVLLIVFPHRVTPPEVMLSALPLAFFAFKMCKMLMLYRYRLKTNLRQSVAAAVAGLAVSHTIARAMLSGLVDNRVGFCRTPKQAEGRGYLRAFFDVREECLLGTTLLFAAATISLRHDAYLMDTRFWIALLCVQSVPYVASVVLSLTSALKVVPASIIMDIPQQVIGKGLAYQSGLSTYRGTNTTITHTTHPTVASAIQAADRSDIGSNESSTGPNSTLGIAGQKPGTNR